MNRKMKSAAAGLIASLLYGGSQLFDQEQRIGILEEIHDLTPDRELDNPEKPENPSDAVSEEPEGDEASEAPEAAEATGENGEDPVED